METSEVKSEILQALDSTSMGRFLYELLGYDEARKHVGFPKWNFKMDYETYPNRFEIVRLKPTGPLKIRAEVEVFEE